jgi:cytochrome b
MHTSPTLRPADLDAGRSRTASPPQRRVVDAPTRMFHWLFALSFAGAYLTAEGERWRALHVSLGYTLAGLLACRVIYGLVGPRHARLGLLLRKVGGAAAWWNSLAQAVRRGTLHDAPWRQGQNLAMALAIVLLMAMAIPLTLSGYGSFNDWGEALGGDWLEDAHEFFGNAVLAVVLSHVGLVIGLSVWRRKNQARPMLTGRIDGPGPDLAKQNRAWLAALLLAGVLAFLGWRWQASPNGLLPSQGVEQTRGERRHGSDD